MVKCKDILLLQNQQNPNVNGCAIIPACSPVYHLTSIHPLCLFIDIQCIYALLASKRERTTPPAVYDATSPVRCWHIVSTYSLHSLGIIISTTEHRRHNEFPPSNRHTEDVKFFRVQSTDDRVQMALDWTDLHWWCIISLHLVGGSRGNMWAKHILHFISLQITISHHKSL